MRRRNDKKKKNEHTRTSGVISQSEAPSPEEMQYESSVMQHLLMCQHIQTL